MDENQKISETVRSILLELEKKSEDRQPFFQTNDNSLLQMNDAEGNEVSFRLAGSAPNQTTEISVLGRKVEDSTKRTELEKGLLKGLLLEFGKKENELDSTKITEIVAGFEGKTKYEQITSRDSWLYYAASQSVVWASDTSKNRENIFRKNPLPLLFLKMEFIEHFVKTNFGFESLQAAQPLGFSASPASAQDRDRFLISFIENLCDSQNISKARTNAGTWATLPSIVRQSQIEVGKSRQGQLSITFNDQYQLSVEDSLGGGEGGAGQANQRLVFLDKTKMRSVQDPVISDEHIKQGIYTDILTSAQAGLLPRAAGEAMLLCFHAEEDPNHAKISETRWSGVIPSLSNMEFASISADGRPAGVALCQIATFYLRLMAAALRIEVKAKQPHLQLSKQAMKSRRCLINFLAF